MKPPAPRARSRRRAAPCALLAALGLVAAAHAQNSGDYVSSPAMPSLPSLPSAPRVRGMIYFPPIPPPLDRPVLRAGAVPSPGRGHAPPELAPHVGEFFYPQLASRLVGDEGLSPRLRQSVATYTGGKLALRRELRAELEKTRALAPAARLQALEALARRQAPRLAELADASEKLRRSLLESDRDWSDFREWRLSEAQRRGYSPLEIAQVMRAFAYFQKGLSLAQRRLLLEIAIDLTQAVDATAKSAGAALSQPFFSPEPARIVLPDDAPPEVAAKFAAYQSKKAALKKQLYDAVHATDGASFTFLHNPLKALAEKQAPAFDELEKLAEEIRRGLPPEQATAKPVERSPVPPALVVRLMALQQDRIANQREAGTKADAALLRTRGQPVRVIYQLEDDGLKFSVMPFQRGGAAQMDQKAIDQVTADFAAIAEKYGQRVAELVNERDAIRRETGETLGTKDAAAIDNALATAARLARAQENADAYAEYRTAVFEPGLSLAQRRLLLDGALQRLDLPLPRGEMQPSRRSSSW